MKRCILLYVLLAALYIMNCAGAKKPIPSEAPVIHGKTVCILYNEKPFKVKVVEEVSKALSEHGLTVVTDKVGNASKYRAADYTAVVYMAELWAKRTPLHAKRYFTRNGQSPNIVFVITSGDPHVTIKKPFDAVTSASYFEKVGTVSSAIMERLAAIHIW